MCFYNKEIFQKIQDYRNTPLLEKVTSHKDLPNDVRAWFLFDHELNEKFIAKVLMMDIFSMDKNL